MWYRNRQGVGMAKAELLAAVLGYVAEHGVGELSLRQVAAGIER